MAGEFRHGELAATAAALAVSGGRLFAVESLRVSVGGKELARSDTPETVATAMKRGGR